MNVSEALGVIARHDGLVRFSKEPGEPPTCRVMLRLPWAPEDRVIAIQDVGDRDPQDALLATVQEALGEVQAGEARRGLRLVGT